MKCLRRLSSPRLCGWLALVLSMGGFLAAAWVTWNIFEAVPHVEDELAYVWQANLLTDGRLSLPSPKHAGSFVVPFVVDHQGLRFGKYPPGWPAVLSLGISLGLRAWVNPLLAGLSVWLTYHLGKRLFNPGVGLLAAALTLTSPFFLLNSGSLLSNPLALALSAGFAWAWLAAFGPKPYHRPWLPTLAASLLLLALQLTRPMTALAVVLPFCIHGLVRLRRGYPAERRRLLLLVFFGLVGVGLHLLRQSLLTSDPLLNPYSLWWPYDRVGFGRGISPAESGYTLKKALSNLCLGLFAGSADLFGWVVFSFLFLPFGVWAARRNAPALLVGGIFPSLVLGYLTYWYGASLFGPRYYYESLFSLVIFSAAGIAWLGGWRLGNDLPPASTTGWRKLRPLLVTWLVGILVGLNLCAYTPQRLAGMVNLYGISAADQQPFRQPEVQALAPALIIVGTDIWEEYGALLDLQSPDLASPLIFAWSPNARRAALLASSFPERSVYYYYPDQPFCLYTAPLP